MWTTTMCVLRRQPKFGFHLSLSPREEGYPPPKPHGRGPSVRAAHLFWSQGPSTNTGSHSPYALRGSPPWGHHLPSDCCPVYLRWPTGSIWESFWSSRTLTNTRRGGNLGRRMRCTPPVADTLEVSPRILLNPIDFPRRQPAFGSQEGEPNDDMYTVTTCHSRCFFGLWHPGLIYWL